MNKVLFLITTLWVGTVGCTDRVELRRTANAMDEDYCSRASIEFLGARVISTNQEVGGIRFGGISGIDYNPTTEEWYLISDDKGDYGPSRFYKSSLDLRKKSSDELTVIEATPLFPDSQSAETPVGRVDPEAIRWIPYSNEIIWSSEGDGRSGVGPSIHRRDLSSTRTSQVQLHASLVRDASKLRGPRDNRSFEGLSVNADGTFWLGLETGLIEDGAPPSDHSGADTRLIHLSQNGDKIDEVIYSMDAIPFRIDGLLADNGVSEILKTSGPSMFVIERSGRQTKTGTFEFSTRLYCASWAPAKSVTPRAIKRLVARLEEHAPAVAANFEGIAFGPQHPDGGRYLLAVSDNNFAEEAPTQISIYRVTPDPTASISK